MDNQQIIDKIIGLVGKQFTNHVKCAIVLDAHTAQVLQEFAQYKLELDAAKTVDECLAIGCHTHLGIEIEKQTLAKAMSFASTIDDWKKCLFKTGTSKLAEAYICIRAIAALLENEQVPA